ncbi:hypothetical protein [Asticcacaulis sp.]|uniref:hypothetical protein n=1 Tax=Asticcacaulis sp. TaxID=1872648 RepID=UPI003F7BB2E4
MEASPDTDDDALSDADRLKARREALRGFVDAIARHIQTLDLPETYLEAERAARAITVHDRAIETLPLTVGDAESDHAQAAIKPVRRLLRRYADRVMEAVTFIPKPLCFLEGERAGRYALAADRMLAQLYEAPRVDTPKPAKAARFADDDLDEEESAYPSGENWKLDLQNRVDRMTRAHARNCGVWPDGSPCLPGAPEPDHPFNEADRGVLLRLAAKDPDPLDKERLTALIIAGRANAVTRARARLDGRWPDYSPYRESDADFYDISARFDETVLKQPPPDPPPTHVETIGPTGFPAWLVRKVPP